MVQIQLNDGPGLQGFGNSTKFFAEFRSERGSPPLDEGPGNLRGRLESELMSKVLKLINAVGKDEEGAALVEYALLIGLIAVVCIIAVTQLGLAISNKLNVACTSLGGTGC